MSMDRINMASRDYKSNLKNLRGTFEVENMKLSDECILNLEQLAKGERACFDIVEALKRKYMQRI